MARLNFCWVIAIALSLVVASSVIAQGAFAQSIPKPSVPEFTVSYVDHSYYVPITSTNYTDPYTGEQEIRKSGGFTFNNKTIDITIKNQPFISTVIDGNTTHLYYELRWKGHYENWTDSEFHDINWYSDRPNLYNNTQYGIQASNSDTTIVSYTNEIGNIPKGGKIDFQVKAQVGFTFLYYGGHIMAIGTLYHYVTESDWSNTQTITIGETTTSSSTPTPTVPELSWLALLPLCLLMLSAVVLKRRKSVRARWAS